MIHTIQLGVASEESLEFWAERLAGKGYASERGERSLSFADYDGLRPRARRRRSTATRRCGPSIPRFRPSTRSSASRAPAPTSAADTDTDRDLLTGTLGFTELADGEYRLDGDTRHFHWGYDAADRARDPGRRNRPPHRLALARRGSRAAGRSASPHAGHARHAGDRSRLLLLDLLPPAAGDPVRDRDELARLRRRRGPRAPRRGAAPAQAARAPAPAAGAPSDPARPTRARPARQEA